MPFEVQAFSNKRREQGRNVVVTLGSDPREIVIGAHFDAVRLRDGSLSAGMAGNAAGTVVLVRVAEALRTQRLHHRVRVVFFDMEEIGLAGSAQFVRGSDPARVAAIVNLDTAGYGNTVVFGPAA